MPLSDDPVPDRRSVPPVTREARAFAQKRAHATYAALLEAARRVFESHGYDDAQTPDIAREAGVSVGTFYRYFTDKRHAFLEMITEHLEQLYEVVMKDMTVEAFGPARTESARREACEHVIDVLFRNTARHPALQRVLLGVALRDPEVAEIRLAFDERSRQALALLIEQVAPPGRIPDAMAAAEVIQIAAQEVALATTGSLGTRKTRAEARALREALATMIYRYVFGDKTLMREM
jgi:AcrR family transcriptional regulator